MEKYVSFRPLPTGMVFTEEEAAQYPTFDADLFVGWIDKFKCCREKVLINHNAQWLVAEWVGRVPASDGSMQLYFVVHSPREEIVIPLGSPLVKMPDGVLKSLHPVLGKDYAKYTSFAKLPIGHVFTEEEAARFPPFSDDKYMKWCRDYRVTHVNLVFKHNEQWIVADPVWFWDRERQIDLRINATDEIKVPEDSPLLKMPQFVLDDIDPRTVEDLRDAVEQLKREDEVLSERLSKVMAKDNTDRPVDPSLRFPMRFPHVGSMAHRTFWSQECIISYIRAIRNIMRSYEKRIQKQLMKSIRESEDLDTYDAPSGSGAKRRRTDDAPSGV